MESYQKHDPSYLKGPWNKRVFIGGSYRRDKDKLETIAMAVKSIEFEPLIADWYDLLPNKSVHSDSLYKLHSCKYAVFEITNPAGQLMEFERARDYETIIFVYCHKSVRYSYMVTDLLLKMKQWGMTSENLAISYQETQELYANVVNRFRRIAEQGG